MEWNGIININGENVPNFNFKGVNGKVAIKLSPKTTNALNGANTTQEEPTMDGAFMDLDKEYQIKVKKWMTEKSTPSFTFMLQWNDDVPMPLMIMVGKCIKETPKMVQMELRGDIVAKVMQTCMCCGKPITNPVSKYFGLGPVCGGHNYTNPFDSEEELNKAVSLYRKKLQKMTWTGWIPKSAIVEKSAIE